jgi:hypothetical protein
LLIENKDALQAVSAKDCGLYILNWYERSKRSGKLWISNGEKIGMTIDDTNECRTNKKKRKKKSLEMNDAERERWR